jgi:hypothetical protein
MSLRKNEMKLKYKLPALIRTFYTPCFSPESRKVIKSIWQVFWLVLLSDYLPIVDGQWYADRTVVVLHERTYSYGDSAGFSPDFPFNGAVAPTKIWANLRFI